MLFVMSSPPPSHAFPLLFCTWPYSLAQTGLELRILWPQLTSIGTTGMCHHVLGLQACVSMSGFPLNAEAFFP